MYSSILAFELRRSRALMAEKNDPRVVSREMTLMDWSSTLTSSLETEDDKFRVMVNRSAIPAKMPWKKEMDLLSFVSIDSLSSNI